jgi:hypothetical protein
MYGFTLHLPFVLSADAKYFHIAKVCLRSSVLLPSSVFCFWSWPILLNHLLKHSLLPSPFSKSLAHSLGVCFCFLFASARLCPTIYELPRPGLPDPSPLCFVFLCPSFYKSCQRCKCTKHTKPESSFFKCKVVVGEERHITLKRLLCLYIVVDRPSLIQEVVARFQRHVCAQNVAYHGSAYISGRQEAQSWRPSSVVPPFASC